jgi:tetratricopeptide (TPR) repeat protein
MVFELIQKPSGTLDLLMYLSEKGASDVTTILKDLDMCTNSFYSAADRLKSLGLAFEKTETGWPTRVYYELTYKGGEAAKDLIPLKETLVESIDAKWKELEKLESARKTKKNKKEMLDVFQNLQKATFDLGKWDETLRVSQKAIELASSLKDELALSHAYRYMGLVHQKRNDESGALENLDESASISARMQDWSGAAEDCHVLGALYERSGDFDRALALYEKSREHSARAEWRIGEGRAQLGVGRILGRRGKYKESLKEMEHAVKEFEELEATDELARAYGGLGATTFFLDRDKALVLYEKSIEVARRTGEVRLRAFGLSNASACYIDKEEFKTATNYLGEAEDIFVKLGDKTALASVYIHRGNIYRLQRNWKESEEYFQESMRISEESGSDYHLGDALYHYGLLLSDKSDPRRSIPVLQRAQAIFEQLGNERKVAKVTKILSEVNQ